MSRSVKDSEDEAEQKTGRIRSQRFTSSIANSPLRRSSRIKQIKSSPPSSESDNSISSHQPTVSRSRRATMDNTEAEKLKRGCPQKFFISLDDDDESIDIDIIGTPKKRTTRNSLAALTTDIPTKINTRAASKRLTRAGSETKSPLMAVRTTRKTRASSVEPESLSDQNRSQPGTPVKTHKRVSNSPKEDEKKIRIPYVRLDATIVEIEELTNSGNSDSSPDKALCSQQGPRIDKKHQSILKDDEEANKDKTSSIVSPTLLRNVSSAFSESDEILQLSENNINRDDIHDEHVDKIMDSETISAEEYKDTEELLSVEDITEVSTEDNFSNLRNKKELEKINKNASEMEKLLDNICKKSATKELMIKIGKLSTTSIEEQKGNPSNKENRTLNITDASIDNNTEPITNVDSTSTKCLTPMCANKSSSEKETKFTKNESSLNEQRHSKESIETTMKHDILPKEGDIEEKMDISTDNSSISDSTLQKYLSSPSVNTTKRQSLVCEVDSKSTIKDTNESVLSQHEDVEIVDRVIVKDKIPIKQISKSTGKIEEVTKNKVGKMEHSIMDTNSDVNKDSNKTELNRNSLLSKSKDDADQKIDKQKPLIIMEVESFIDGAYGISRCHTSNFSEHATKSVPKSSNIGLKIDYYSDESNEDNSESFEYVSSIASERAERKRMCLENLKSTDDVHDHMEKERENLQLKNQKNTNIDPDVIVSTDLLRDTFNDNSNKKIIEKEIDIEIISMNSNSESLKKPENESENESDLIMMNKKTLKAAENLKAAKAAESTGYDSENSVVSLKNQVNDMITKSHAKQLSTINEKLLESQEDAMVGNRDKKSLIMMEEEKMDYDNKAISSSKDKKQHVLKKYEDSFSDTEDEDDLTAAVNKSLIEYKANKSLNKSGDRSVSKLNKSGQTVTKTTERSFKIPDESDEQVEDDANELNRSSPVNEKNTSLSKSVERRKSLNKSSTKDIPLKQGDKAMQNISINKSQLDHSKNEPDTYLGKKLKKKKHSLSKSQSQDENASEPKEQSSSKPVNTKSSTDLNDDESNDNEILISVMDFGCKSYSATACMRSTTPCEMLDSSDEDNSKISKLAMINSDTEASTSVHSDIKREYNLDGAEQKFSDDNIPGDECRASESEDSDPDDDGSDLIDFIVNDNEIENEEDNDDEEKESNNEGENEQNIEEIGDAEKEEAEDTEEEEAENAEEEEEDTEKEEAEDAEEEEEDEDAEVEEAGNAEEEEVDDESENEQNVKEKDKVARKKKIKDKSYKQAHINMEILDEEEDTDNEKSIKYISSPLNTKMSSSSEIKSTKIKRDSKKSNTMKTILLDTSDSDSSIKNKSSTQKKKDTILLDASSNLSTKKKEKSEVQFSSKNVTEQNLMDQLNKLEEAGIRKFPKSRQNISLEHSTPKFDICKKIEFYETLEENSEIKDTKSDSSTKTIQNTSLKKKELKIKDDTQEKRKLAKLVTNKHFETHFEKLLSKRPDSDKNSEMDGGFRDFLKSVMLSYQSKLTERTEKAGSSKPSSGMAELHKTVDVIHTESPTIRYLRKEKLNESAPELKVNIETDSNSDQLKKKLSPVKPTKDIAQTETKLESDKEISNLVIPLNDETVQKSNRKKQKKHETPAEDILDENITDKVLNQDMRESNVPKKKKYIKFDTIIEDDTCKDTQINENEKKKKKKKKKKRQLKIIEQNQNENVNEADVLQKNIRKNKTKLVQHKGENDEIKDYLDLDLSDNYTAVEKETKLPKIAENKEIISEELLKKKRKETTSSSQIEISKLKSDKNLASNKSQDIASDMIKTKNAAFVKAREEALEAIYATEMRLRAKKELKKKKQEDEKNTIQKQQVLKTPDKTQRKQVVEKNDFSQPSTSRVKRLPDDVIENLPDQLTKAKKKRKLSQDREWTTSLKHSSTTVKDEGFTLSSTGSTTQFTVVNLPKAKKLSSKSSAAAVSFRQRMLARNSREPVSAYMMYLEKHKATNQSSRNAF